METKKFERKWKASDIEAIRLHIVDGKSVKYLSQLYTVSEDAMRKLMSRNKIGVRASQSGKHSRNFSKQTKLSISERIMELCGLDVKDSKAPKYFSDEQLLKWREGLQGFEAFAKEVLDVEIMPHQRDLAEKMINNRLCVFILGRRSGKSFICALYCLWRAIIAPSERVCLISPTYESSLIIFKQLLEFVAISEELRWDIARDTADELEFRNKSNIKSLSAQSLALRGRENSIVVIDEVSSLENEQAVMSAVSPSLASRKGSQLVLISTPKSRQGILWDAWNSPIYAKAKYPSTANTFNLDIEWLELEKKKLPPEVFQMEYLAEFSDASEMFFPTALINKCVKSYDFAPPLFDKTYFLGIDIGRLRDLSVVVVLSKTTEGELKVENIVQLFNVPFEAQRARFNQIIRKYQVQKVCIEYNGLSMQIVEQMEADYNKSKIVRFVPTIKSKEEAYFKLSAEMENGRMTLPNHEKLLNEMRNFGFVYSAKGIKLHAKTGHDDHCDALSMSCWIATRKSIGGYWSV